MLVWRLLLALIFSKSVGLVPFLLLTTLLSSSGLKSSVSWLPLKTLSRENLILNLKENLKALHFWHLSGRDLHQQSECPGKRREKVKSLVPYLEPEQFVPWKSFRGVQNRKLKICFGNVAAFFVWFLTDKSITGFEQPKSVLGGFPSVMSFLVENQLSQWCQCQLWS